MTSNWRIYPVSELQSAGKLLIEDGNHGEYRPRRDEFVADGISFIRAADMSNGRILFASAERINETALTRIRKGIGCPGDVLLSSKGTVGKLTFASLNCEPFVCSPQVTFWRSLDNEFLDRRFLFYYIQSSKFQEQIMACSSETDMAPYLSLTNQRTFKIAIPDIDEQKTIAHILGTLDDKIELNQQMNQTLESIARTLFKSWFIDFDPVRAKMDGRQPAGMDAETAALFPDEFEDGGAIGQIPKGWKPGVLKDIAENPKRTIHPEQIPAGTPYIGLEHMPKRNISLFDWGLSDNLESNKFQFKQGEILFGKLRPYFHKVGVAIQDGVCSTDILVIVPKYSEWFSLVLAYVSSDGFIDYTNMSSDGTRMPRTNWQVMGQHPIVIPSVELAQAFNFKISIIVQTIRSHIFQAKTLASIRDVLLPKLLSGEIRVKDAEKVVEAVT